MLFVPKTNPLNKSYKNLHYSAYYNDAEIEIVRSIFLHDIERFGYTFDKE